MADNEGFEGDAVVEESPEPTPATDEENATPTDAEEQHAPATDDANTAEEQAPEAAIDASTAEAIPADSTVVTITAPEQSIQGNDDREEERAINAKSVYVQVVFMKVGEIETVKETFWADVFVQARWREPSLDGKDKAENQDPINFDNYWNPRIVIDNTIGDPKENKTTGVVYDTKTWQAFIAERRRVKSTFHETMELFNFPFDTQDLTVTLTSELPDSEVVLVEDPDQLSTVNTNSFADVQEWRLFDEIQILKGSVSRFQLVNANNASSHSFLSCQTNASRRYGYYIYSVFMTMLFIISLTFCTFSVDYVKRENRIQMTFVILLTTVTFKFAINSSLPRISYLTTVDVYIMSSSFMLILICIWHAVVIPFNSIYGEALAALADKYVLVGFMAIYYAAHIFMALKIGTRTANLTSKYKLLELKQKAKLRKFESRSDGAKLQDKDNLKTIASTEFYQK